MQTIIYAALETGVWVALIILCLVLGAGIGVFVGYAIRLKKHDKTISNAKEEARKIVEQANNDANQRKKELINDAKEEIALLKQEADQDIKDRKSVVVELENKLNQREDMLDRRSSNLDHREDLLSSKENKIDEKKAELEQQNIKVEAILKKQEQKLIEIGNLNKEEAKKLIMDNVKESMKLEIASYIKEEEEKARDIAQAKARDVLALAIQKYAGDSVSETTVSTVSLPAEEMKGRIIGREGRNIRTIESLTGVDLIIDDTPEAIVLSGFDPVRREIAKKSLEILVSDGRIHPARIEAVVERCRSEVEMSIREMGEDAVFKTGIGKVHPDLIKLLGRLHFRTSYGQNVLDHSIETAMLAGKLAAEIGENEILARRAGLFHDIGKAVDHEIEDVPPESVIAVLVAAADALSSARPGARSDSLENYTKRLENLEAISNSIKGVQSSFAVQAGLEVRVIVNPEEVDDVSTFSIARQIKEEIENKLSYPGTIKVTVVRETRAVEVAK